MVTEKEYLALSIMSYYNFDVYDKDVDLYKYLTNVTIDAHKWIKFRKLSVEQVKVFLDYFKEELAKWKILSVYDNRAKSLGKKTEKTGFYSVVFTNGDDVVLSFRGSEVFPYEEAYKDFIENNLLLGMGRKPKQFLDAVDAFEQIIYKYSIDINRISLTGHSLGGGIAQYVAAYSKKTRGYIPKVVTWNAVGIKRNALFSIDEFIDLKEILKTEDCTEVERECILNTFQQEYYLVLQNSLKKGVLELDKILEGSGKKDNLLKICLNKITKNGEEQSAVKDKIINILLKNSSVTEGFERAKLFFEELSNNTVYDEKISNYGHSKDITFNLYEHLGSSYVIDDYLKIKKIDSFFNTILDKKKFFSNYHYDDVFLPFFINEGEYRGSLSTNLNMESVVSTLRYFIYHEDGFSNELLGAYYSLSNLEYGNIDFLRTQILHGLKNTKTLAIYKDRIIKLIEESNSEKIQEIWEETKKRMPSPYIMYDIYDAILY